MARLTLHCGKCGAEQDLEAREFGWIRPPVAMSETGEEVAGPPEYTVQVLGPVKKCRCMGRR